MLDEAAKMIRDNHDLFELTLHGIGHEYWKTGMMSRAEWHDENGTMRPKESVAAHLRVFLRLLKQNDLGPFPESFVPTAFLHRFGAGEEGLPGMLAEYGVKYMSTPFSMMHAVKQPESDLFGIDGPLITVNRGKDLCEWNEIAPDVAGEIHGPICGMHWPNLLHPDPDRNGEVVERWGRLLETYQRRFDTMLAPNTAEGFSQLIYRWGTELQYDDFGCKLDFSKLSSCKPPGLLDSFTLKVERKWNIVSSSPEIHLFENQQQSTTEYKSILIKRQSSAKSAYIHWKLNEESD